MKTRATTVVRFIQWLAIWLAALSCGETVPSITPQITPNTNLQIWSNDTLSAEYFYTKAYQLQKEIQYVAGVVKATFDYTYNDQHLLSKVIVTHETQGVGLKDQVNLEYPDENTIAMTLTRLEGSANVPIPDYPFRNALISPSTNFPKITIVFTFSQELITTDYTHYEFDAEGKNVSEFWYYIWLGGQLTRGQFFNYGTKGNFFNKFGLVKFDPVWLSKNNVVQFTSCNYSVDYGNWCLFTQNYEYQKFDVDGNPLLVIETGTLGTVKHEYRYLVD